MVTILNDASTWGAEANKINANFNKVTDSTKIVDGKYIAFPNAGFYDYLGTLYPNENFSSSDKLTLPDALMVYTQTYIPNNGVADLCFFNDADQFVGYLRLNEVEGYTLHMIKDYPATATKFAMTIRNNSYSYCRMGELNNAVQLLENRYSWYSNKIAMYIGDSIYTTDDYQWKGILQRLYKINPIKYITTDLSPIAPAVPGIPLFPPVPEIEYYESIWHRCANQRFAGHVFDFMVLGGGTNDLAANETFEYGTKDDVPYLDTDVRPEGLTWASAFKGCIEMLQRDYPAKELIIATVLNSNYGTEAYLSSGYSRAEYMANLQMDIALDYGLKCIPFYWMSGINSSNYQRFLIDNVHPNRHGAERMVKVFAETLHL
jgi:hypothetical protein